MADGMSTLEYEKATGWVNQSVTQLDFYTFFRKLLKQISFLYFPDRGCDPARLPLYWNVIFSRQGVQPRLAVLASLFTAGAALIYHCNALCIGLQ